MMGRRLFTNEQEAELARRIRDDYLAHGCLFTDADFRLLAIEAYYAWNPIEVDEEAPTFQQFGSSNGFIHNFKKRNRFSSRRSHFKRRAPPNPALENQFLTEIHEIMSRTDPQFILNCDETSWRLYPNGILTWADKGSQNIAVAIRGNEKEALTVMATVTRAGTKLPLYILAKGETTRCETSQLGELGENAADHSSSGWMTEHAATRYHDFGN
jgi:hypothetical protein